MFRGKQTAAQGVNYNNLIKADFVFSLCDVCASIELNKIKIIKINFSAAETASLFQ